MVTINIFNEGEEPQAMAKETPRQQ